MTNIQTDINLDQVVYIDHLKYKVTKIFTPSTLNQFAVQVTNIVFELKFIDKQNMMPSATPIKYRRNNFLTKFQYKEQLIDKVNKLTKELDND